MKSRYFVAQFFFITPLTPMGTADEGGCLFYYRRVRRVVKGELEKTHLAFMRFGKIGLEELSAVRCTRPKKGKALNERLG